MALPEGGRLPRALLRYPAEPAVYSWQDALCRRSRLQFRVPPGVLAGADRRVSGAFLRRIVFASTTLRRIDSLALGDPVLLAFRRPRPVLRFCWAFLLIAPLPIEFLQGRGSASLYIPFIGWA